MKKKKKKIPVKIPYIKKIPVKIPYWAWLGKFDHFPRSRVLLLRPCGNCCKARKPRTFSPRERRKKKSWPSATPWSCKEGGSPRNKRTAPQPSTWRKVSMLFSGSRKPTIAKPSAQSCIWLQ